jgi:hypothetical protein
VAEYFLFDPQSEYLSPALQGHRLRRGRYLPIAPVAGRLPSKELGLHLEADGSRLRFYDPANKRWLPTPQEARLEVLDALEQKGAALKRSEAARRRSEAETERLRQELAALRRQP